VTRATALCPSCGGPVEWVSAASVQTTCPYCTSVLVRTDLDLRAVGVKSTVPPTVSPIRLGTRGTHQGRAFTVAGRLVYAYERGRWNEWHLAYDDGGTGWLSDAQAEYAITRQVAADRLPAAHEARPGMPVDADGERFTVTSVTTARYAGTEGELPFEKWNAVPMRFADLRGEKGRFGTVDYSETPPLLFAGHAVTFDELGLTGLREPEAIQAVAQTVRCPNCTGSVTVRAADRTVNVVCEHCWSVLDARTPGFQVLQTFESRLTRKPRIALGTAGTLHGHEWEVIGFQVRSIRSEGRDYPWDEYLLFSPSQGFRYLTEYQGHWSEGATLRELPQRTNTKPPAAIVRGQRFRHFQRAQAATTFVLGEFPWEVRVGDTVMVSDYVAPPLMLSAEETPEETTWTLSEYLPGAAVWKAFGLKGDPPGARGVYANQPAPSGAPPGRLIAVAMLLLAALAAMAIVHYSSGGRTVETRRFSYQPWGPDSAQQGQVIGPMQLGGRTSNVEIDLRASLDNSWAYFDLSLADSAGHATEFGSEVSWYEGVEGGEHWTEGSRGASVRVPSVPAGRYWLRVEPQGEKPYDYEVKVRRDVPFGWMYLVAALLLIVPPAFSGMRRGVFESARWAESDYAPSG